MGIGSHLSIGGRPPTILGGAEPRAPMSNPTASLTPGCGIPRTVSGAIHPGTLPIDDDMPAHDGGEEPELRGDGFEEELGAIFGTIRFSAHYEKLNDGDIRHPEENIVGKPTLRGLCLS